MSSEKLGIEVGTEPPKTFIRGQSLEFLMELPCDVPKDYFHTSTTTLACQLRSLENAGTDGLIDALIVTFEPNTNHTKLRFKAENTEDWPIGPAEFDVLFTRTVALVVKKVRSQAVKIMILDGVTK
jgi:hypothetical protein